MTTKASLTACALKPAFLFCGKKLSAKIHIVLLIISGFSDSADFPVYSADSAARLRFFCSDFCF